MAFDSPYDPYADAEAIVRLTPLQQAMLAHSRFAGGGAYIGQMSVRLRGSLDPARVTDAFQQLIARHEALRTLFVSEGLDEPLQVAKRAATLSVRVEDLSQAHNAEARIQAFLAEDRTTPFDLLRPPLMRVALFDLGGDHWHLVLSRHHLIMDGWSATLLFRELEALIAGDRDLPPAEPFHRFVEWLEARDSDAARAHWREQLAGAGEATAIFPTERLARGELPATLHETIRPLDPALTEQAAAAARRHGVTAQTLYAGAWAILAARYSGSQAAQFGVTVAGRPDDLPGVTTSVGLFIDTVPLAISTTDDAPAGAWLEAVQHQLADAGRHAHLGLAELRASAGLAPDQALFSHILVLEAYGHAARSRGRAGDRSLSLHRSDQFRAQHRRGPGSRRPSRRGVRSRADRFRRDRPAARELRNRDPRTG